MAWSDPRQTPAASLHHGPATPACKESPPARRAPFGSASSPCGRGRTVCSVKSFCPARGPNAMRIAGRIENRRRSRSPGPGNGGHGGRPATGEDAIASGSAWPRCFSTSCWRAGSSSISRWCASTDASSAERPPSCVRSAVSCRWQSPVGVPLDRLRRRPSSLARQDRRDGCGPSAQKEPCTDVALRLMKHRLIDTNARHPARGKGSWQTPPRRRPRLTLTRAAHVDGLSLSSVLVSKSPASCRSRSWVDGSPCRRLTIRPRFTAGRAAIAWAHRWTFL